MEKLGHRSISEIAYEIARLWKTPYFGAVPYIAAMKQIDGIKDRYIAEDGVSLVLYFLSNATGWRGDDARRIKEELKVHLRSAGVKVK